MLHATKSKIVSYLFVRLLDDMLDALVVVVVLVNRLCAAHS